MQRQYSRVRETAFDLYAERDALPWYYRATALASAWFALAGYIIFALVFTSGERNIRISRTALTVRASSALAVGYVAIAAVAFYARSLLFLYDAVLLPILTSSVMGIVITVLNHAIHKDLPLPTEAYIYIPLVTACTTTVAAALLMFTTYRKLAKIKRLDRHRRQHLPTYNRNASMSYGDAVSTTELLPIDPTLPEDEAQRRQLLRLLLKREVAQSSPAMPSGESTYKIFLPGDEGFGGVLVVPPEGRPRSGSLPNTSKWNILSKVSRDRSPTVESTTFKDHRQRRREEIERTSILMPSGTESPWLQTPGASSPYYSSQSQTWGGSTRYA